MLATEMTFEKLVEFATQQIHLGLIEEGGKGMKSRVWLWMGQAIEWSKAQDKPTTKRRTESNTTP